MEKIRKLSPMLSSALFYGAIAAGLFIIWFFVMRAFGLHDNFRLRYLNYPIMFACTYVCLNRMMKDARYTFSYLAGLAQSMMVAGVAVIIFGAFMFLYLRSFDPALMQHLVETAPFGWLMTPMRAAFWTGHEIFGFQVLFSLIVMEYFKMVRNRKGTLKNVNLVNFAERPARKRGGIVLLILGFVAIIATLITLIDPESYPHISGLLKIDSNNLYRVKWLPIIGALCVAGGIIRLSNSFRRTRIIQ